MLIANDNSYINKKQILKTKEKIKYAWKGGNKTRSQQLTAERSIKPDPMPFPEKSVHSETMLRSNTEPTRAIYREIAGSAAY